MDQPNSPWKEDARPQLTLCDLYTAYLAPSSGSALAAEDHVMEGVPSGQPAPHGWRGRGLKTWPSGYNMGNSGG